MAKDVVCGMEVDEKKTKYKVNHKGQKYFFCSADCKESFTKDPEHFLSHIM